MLQLNAHQQSILFQNLTPLPFCGTFIRTVTMHNLQGNDTGTTQHKQTKKHRKVQLIFIQRSQHSIIPIMYSIPTNLSIPCISKMCHLTIRKSHRIKSILKKKCGHSPHIPQITYLKEPTPVFPKRFCSRTPFGFGKKNTDPPSIAHINTGCSDNTYPKLKIYISELILDNYEFIQYRT
jgi:hypothetical protein